MIMVRKIFSNTLRQRSMTMTMSVGATTIRRQQCGQSLHSQLPTAPIVLRRNLQERPIQCTAGTTRLLSTTSHSEPIAASDSHKAPQAIKIVEVGPRDGLQNEPPPIVSIPDKLEFIRMLERAGCPNIEVGAFVSPKWIPQMSGSAEVLEGLRQPKKDESTSTRSRYSVLIPNLKGLETALASGEEIIDEIAIFGAASEEFTKRNINSTIDESLEKFRVVVNRVRELQEDRNRPLLVRGYVSTVIGCPYQGPIEPKQVASVVEKMLELGCYEISLGDTIGVGAPHSTRRMLDEVLNVAKPPQLAMHCHDTYGQALVNILVGLEKEIYTIDSSVAGLGGCPYAKGASGNVATEDVIYMLRDMGFSTGIDLNKLMEAGDFISNALNRPTNSKVAKALKP